MVQRMEFELQLQTGQKKDLQKVQTMDILLEPQKGFGKKLQMGCRTVM